MHRLLILSLKCDTEPSVEAFWSGVHVRQIEKGGVHPHPQVTTGVAIVMSLFSHSVYMAAERESSCNEGVSNEPYMLNRMLMTSVLRGSCMKVTHHYTVVSGHMCVYTPHLFATDLSRVIFITARELIWQLQMICLFVCLFRTKQFKQLQIMNEIFWKCW